MQNVTSLLDSLGKQGIVNRRNFLAISALAGLGVQSVQARTRERFRPIVVFFQGGAQSPYEFVSPIEGASGFRGDVTSKLAGNGQYIDSRWEKTAPMLKHAAVVKSLHSGNTSHNAYYVLGKEIQKGADKFAYGGLPHPFIELPSIFSDRAQLKPNVGLHIQWKKEDKRYVPPVIESDANLCKRKQLLDTLEKDSKLSGPAVELMDKNRELAFSLLSGGDAITKPFEKVQGKLDRYGDNQIGRSAALAASFAESGAGISFVYNEKDNGWDMHSKVKERSDRLIPPTDQAVAALIQDAHEQGFILLVTSEHGRTPKINGSGGRDHHHVGYAVAAGPGITSGETVGNIDSVGEIARGKVTGEQLMNSIYHAAGVDVSPIAPRIREINI